jgi:hypothetical protein
MFYAFFRALRERRGAVLRWPPTDEVVQGGNDLRRRLVSWVGDNWTTMLHGTSIGLWTGKECAEYVAWLLTCCGGDLELAILGLIFGVTVVILERPQGGSAIGGPMQRAPEYVPNFALFPVCKTKAGLSGQRARL